ncbi:hypothetical protein BH24CHL5_BH24CHL5_00300 [soil metagenome]
MRVQVVFRPRMESASTSAGGNPASAAVGNSRADGRVLARWPPGLGLMSLNSPCQYSPVVLTRTLVKPFVKG